MPFYLYRIKKPEPSENQSTIVALVPKASKAPTIYAGGSTNRSGTRQVTYAVSVAAGGPA
jgi:hypothetical protein